MRRVVITGLGVLSGYGRGVAKLWDGLCSGSSAVREHRADFGGRSWVRYPMAALRDDTATLAAGLPNPQVVRHESLERDADLVAIADCIGQAVSDAGLEYDPEANQIGLIVNVDGQSFVDEGDTSTEIVRAARTDDRIAQDCRAQQTRSRPRWCLW